MRGGIRRYIVERITVISILIYFSNTLNAGYPHWAASFMKVLMGKNKALAISAEIDGHVRKSGALLKDKLCL